MARGSHCWTVLFLLLLGCAAPAGVAQDGGQEPPAAQPDPSPSPAPTTRPSKRRKVEPKRFRAVLRERGAESDFVLREAALFVPEVSLFGGGDGDSTDTLLLTRGAAEIRVPMERVARLEVREERDDRLEVRVHLRPLKEGEPAPTPLDGSILAALELRGTFEETGLETSVRLRQVSEVRCEQ